MSHYHVFIHEILVLL